MARLQPINLVRSGDFDTSRSILAGGAAKARRKTAIGENIGAAAAGFVEGRQEKQLMNIKLQEADMKAKIFKMTGGRVGSVDAWRKLQDMEATSAAYASAAGLDQAVEMQDPTMIAKASQGLQQAGEVKSALAPTPSSEPRMKMEPVDLSGVGRAELTGLQAGAAVADSKLDSRDAALSRLEAKTALSLKASIKVRTPKGEDRVKAAVNQLKSIRMKRQANAAQRAKLAGEGSRMDARGKELARGEALGKTLAAEDRADARIVSRARAAAGRERDEASRVGAMVNATWGGLLKELEPIFAEDIVGPFGKSIGKFEQQQLSIGEGEDAQVVSTRIPDEVLKFIRFELGGATTDEEFRKAVKASRSKAESVKKVEAETRMTRRENQKNEIRQTLQDAGKGYEKWASNLPGFNKDMSESTTATGMDFKSINARFFALARYLGQNPIDPDMLATISDSERVMMIDSLYDAWGLEHGYSPPDHTKPNMRKAISELHGSMDPRMSGDRR